MAKTKTRRDFIYIATGAFGAAGAGAVMWPFIAQMGPAADTNSYKGVLVDLAKIDEGQQIRLLVRGYPIYIRHRTPKEIREANDVKLSDLRDPESDLERLRPLPDGTYNQKYLVIGGACTHFGVLTVGEKGDYGGWYCPNGAHFDTSGRVRKGTPPKNLVVPDYYYLTDTTIRITRAKY